LSNLRLATLADYTAATGQEAHGISQDPGFAAPTTADFTPAPGSPLVDRGLTIPGINDGYSGLGPDVGAIEAPWPDRARPCRLSLVGVSGIWCPHIAPYLTSAGILSTMGVLSGPIGGQTMSWGHHAGLAE
jgi:hypothetical protein